MFFFFFFVFLLSTFERFTRIRIRVTIDWMFNSSTRLAPVHRGTRDAFYTAGETVSYLKLPLPRSFSFSSPSASSSSSNLHSLRHDLFLFVPSFFPALPFFQRGARYRSSGGRFFFFFLLPSPTRPSSLPRVPPFSSLFPVFIKLPHRRDRGRLGPRIIL